MKKSIFAGLATFVLALFTVTPATAESYDVDDECVPSEAWTEEISHPAVGEPQIEVPNPDYVEAWTETIEHPAVTHVEWKWQLVGKLTGIVYDKVWSVGKPGSDTLTKKWVRTSVTREVVDEPAWTEYVDHPAVGEPTILVDNPDYEPAWTEYVDHPAVVCEEPEPEPTDQPQQPEPADPEPTQPPAQPAPPAAPPAAPAPASPTFTG